VTSLVHGAAQQQHNDHDLVDHDDRNHHSTGGGSAIVRVIGPHIYDLDSDDIACE
jgi:hypothetical protein